MILLLHGCFGALLEDELVLGEELAAVTVHGEPMSLLGSAAAVGASADGETLVAIGAPGIGEVVVVDASGVEQWRLQGEVGLGRQVWMDGTDVLAWLPGVGVIDASGGVVHAAPDAAVLARCPDGSWWSASKGRDALDCSASGLLRSTCEESVCTVSVESPPGGSRRVLGQSTPHGAVAWVDGEACWGDVDLLDATSTGTLRCEDGFTVQGLEGDHLGVSIGAGRVAGVFNKWQIPARTRMVPIEDGVVWSVDRAVEGSRVTMTAGADVMVVGVPRAITETGTEGRVYLVQP